MKHHGDIAEPVPAPKYGEIANELLRLMDLSNNTADGIPDGLGDTEAAVFDYFNQNFDAIIYGLLFADSKELK